MRLELAKELEKKIARCAHRGHWREATQLLSAAQERGHTPPAGAFAGVIHSFAKYGYVDKAKLWLSKMETIRVMPDVECYRAAIHACAKVKPVPDIANAEFLFNRMKHARIKPTNVIFSSMITCFANNNDIVTARKYLDMLKTYHLTPCLYVLNPILGAYIRAGEVDSAKAILYKMIDLKLPPDVVSMNLVLHHLNNRHSAPLIKIFRDMMAAGTQGNNLTYNFILTAISKDEKLIPDKSKHERYTGPSERIRQATYWFEHMLKTLSATGEVPILMSYNIMITICSREHDAEGAQYWVNQAKAAGLVPNAFSYTSLCHAHANNGDHQSIKRVF
jgi:pentatricopeptide repeat protein